MSKLSQTLKVVSGTSTYQVPFYTTTEEASGYGECATANVGGVLCYYPLGLGTAENTGSEVKTPWQVMKGSTKYYVLTDGEYVAVEEVQLYVTDDDVEIIFIYNDTELTDLTNVSFTNSNKQKIVYMDKKLNISTTILNAANNIIIPADSTLYDALKDDSYWTNYISKISFIQSYNTNTAHVGKDISAENYDTLGRNLTIDNNQCILDQYEYTTLNGTTETSNSISYKKYIIPNSSNTIYDVY